MQSLKKLTVCSPKVIFIILFRYRCHTGFLRLPGNTLLVRAILMILVKYVLIISQIDFKILTVIVLRLLDISFILQRTNYFFSRITMKYIIHYHFTKSQLEWIHASFLNPMNSLTPLVYSMVITQETSVELLSDMRMQL